jgi:hypothetical protein
MRLYSDTSTSTVLRVDTYKDNTQKSIQTSILRVDTYIRYYTSADTTLLCLVNILVTKKIQTKKYNTVLLIQRIPILRLQAIKNIVVANIQQLKVTVKVQQHDNQRKRFLFQNILDNQIQQKTKPQTQILLPILQLNIGE